jgi:hypothetical protein
MEGAGEHLSGLCRVSTPGYPYLQTSHAHQRRHATGFHGSSAKRETGSRAAV